jgi:hypothetical protein
MEHMGDTTRLLSFVSEPSNFQDLLKDNKFGKISK